MSAAQVRSNGESAAPPVVGRQGVIAVVASTLGWSLDLFDLFILLFVAKAIAPLFFPSHSATLSLAATYAAFAVTLVMRPVGSALFGHMADTRGRRRAMIVAVIGVGLATALFAVLPTYGSIGVLATVLFLVLRLLQGVFVGGVVASTHTIGTESVPERFRGAMSGLIGGGGAALGALIASIIFFVVSTALSAHAFNAYGWRIMFASGILSSIFGVLLFRTLEESPLFERAAHESGRPPKAPLRRLFSAEFLPIFALNLLIVAGAATQYYLTSGFLPTYLGSIKKINPQTSALILAASSVVVLVAALLGGQLSEWIGRKRAFLVLGVVTVAGVPALNLLLESARSLAAITLLAMALGFVGNLAYAPVVVFLNERFPTVVRATGTGVSWNVGFAVGGMMPTFVALASPSVGDIPERLAIFTAVAAAVYLAGAALSRETRGRVAAEDLGTGARPTPSAATPGSPLPL